MGRPIKPINEDLVEKLAMIGCTMKEIAAICDVSVDTLERRFAELIEKGKEQGKSSLRRMQWKSAEGGNVVMQIWLGKQLLGQKDRMKTENYNVVDLRKAFFDAVNRPKANDAEES